MGMITEDLHLNFINPFCLYDNRRNLHKTIRFCRTDFPKFQTIFIMNFRMMIPHRKSNWSPRLRPAVVTDRILLQNSEMTVFENPDRYVVLFPQMQNLYEAHMLKDGTYVRIYCHPQVSETNIENLFHTIRLFFLFTAQRNGLFAIHSASVLYQGKAWLFSGHSGMGKSTHTALWHELFDTPYLNGDLNLLGLKEDHIIVYGIPWCGTSGIFTAEAYELGGIVLLGRDLQTDYLEELNPSEKVLRVMQRMISPAWTERQLSENLFFAGEIADRVPVLHLLCTKNASAACVMKNAIDQLEELQ